MKKVRLNLIKLAAIIICLAGTATIFAQEETGVVINGVTWATRNVGAVGTFAESSESHGMFYQWNRKKTLPAKSNVADMPVTATTSTMWEAINDPSPDGWRVPTKTEMKKLLDTTKVEYEWITTKNGVKGGRFTDKVTSKSIFLPATGIYLDHTDSYDHGHYWTNTDANGSNAYHLAFGIGGSGLYHSNYGFGFSIRPVKNTISEKNL